MSDIVLTAGHVKVRGGGGVELVPTSALKRGDLIVLERGDRVPADCRLLECHCLRIQEADLTGDSEPADKIPDKAGTSDQSTWEPCSMAYMGTRVVAGDGLAEVVATGKQTRWAQIAALSQTVQRKPPPRRYEEVEQTLLVLLLAFIGLLLLLGLMHVVQSFPLALLPADLRAT